jgi:hypothetical protein
MPVIPFPQGHRYRESAPVPAPNRESRIHGTFPSPSGRVGTMTGCLRLDRFIMVSDQLCASGVFAGELLDADGTTIGWGSRRKACPAEIVRGLREATATIGPVEVDLMGMTVSVAAFTINTGARTREPAQSLQEPRRSSALEPLVSSGYR